MVFFLENDGLLLRSIPKVVYVRNQKREGILYSYNLQGFHNNM